jgi:hypothetical protein
MKQEQYRNKSIGRLKKLKVNIPNHLPLLESEEELSPKSLADITGKISALGYVIGMGYTDDTKRLIKNIKKYNLWPYVSKHEKMCLKKPKLISKQDRINFQWLCECIYALAWCLSIVDLNPKLGCPDDLADMTVPGQDVDVFRSDKQLRPMDEIQAEADFYYCLHWHERNCRLRGRKGLINEGVIWERRRALDWVIGVSDDWDDMPNDT